MLTRREAAAAIAATAPAVGAGGALRAEDMAARPLPPPRWSVSPQLDGYESLRIASLRQGFFERPLAESVAE